MIYDVHSIKNDLACKKAGKYDPQAEYQLLETKPDMAEVMELANGEVKQLQTGSIYSRKQRKHEPDEDRHG